jgi:hypothetical protein
MMKGEPQKIVHQGTKEKVNALITLLYPYNGIKFNMTGKTRNSRDFINHLKNIKMYVMKRRIKRFILVIDNASFHVSKKSTNYIKNQSEWLSVVYLPKKAPFLNLVETKVNRNLKKDICANYCYETGDDLMCYLRKYLRGKGCWPRI